MAAKAGKWVMGHPPYGYKLKKTQKIEIVPQEAKWVKKFFEWLVYESCTLGEVARRANDLKVPQWADGRRAKRKAAMWWPRTLGRMLTNETYTGVAYFLKHKSKTRGLTPWLEPDRLLNDRERWIPIKVPAIVPRELFEAGLRQLKKNREFAARKAKRVYLFSKLIYCGECGFIMRGQFALPDKPNGTGSRYYMGYAPHQHRANSKRCSYCGCVTETRLLPIWDTLRLILKNPNFVYDKLRRYSERKIEGVRTDERLREIEKELISLEKTRERINVAYLDTNSISEREYRRRLQNNKASHEKLINERLRLTGLQISDEEKSKQGPIIEKLYQKLRKNLENASYETKSKIIHICIDKINLFLKQNYAEVVFNFAGEVLQDGDCNHRPAKQIELTVKIPLISEKEIQKIAILHLQDPKGYREKTAALLANLAVEKAKETYL